MHCNIMRTVAADNINFGLSFFVAFDGFDSFDGFDFGMFVFVVVVVSGEYSNAYCK